MSSKHKINSYTRRRFLTDQIRHFSSLNMRPCSFYVARHVTYVTFSQSDHCEQCLRNNRYYELTPPSASEMARLYKENRRLSKRALAAEIKTLKFRRQRQLIRDRFQTLKDREIRNIAELEINEMIVKNIGII